MNIPSLAENLPEDWAHTLRNELAEPWVDHLEAFLQKERQTQRVFPPCGQVFTALQETSFADARVVIIGQDPYHDDHQAHGLAFSVNYATRIPPSLRNIFAERERDLGLPPPDHGCLTAWARRGVLLLNTVLTVRAHEPHSHRNKGWERFTDAIVKCLSERRRPAVFILWGKPAQKKTALIDADRNGIVTGAHPSPLSARRGFFGSSPFSQANKLLSSWGEAPVDWTLPRSQQPLPGLEYS